MTKYHQILQTNILLRRLVCKIWYDKYYKILQTDLFLRRLLCEVWWYFSSDSFKWLHGHTTSYPWRILCISKSVYLGLNHHIHLTFHKDIYFAILGYQDQNFMNAIHQIPNWYCRLFNQDYSKFEGCNSIACGQANGTKHTVITSFFFILLLITSSHEI